MFNPRSYSLHEKIYILSFIATFFGTLLPWLLGLDEMVLGIEILTGMPLMILLIISANVSFFWRNKYKRVSIINILLGLLCFSAASFTYFSSNFVVFDTVFGAFIRYGIGIYLTMIGSLGIVISGIVGLIRKGQ